MTDDPNAFHPIPIRRARADTPHPVARIWHGLKELTAFSGQALLALSELVRPRRDDTDPAPRPRHKRPHPVEKSAPFPVND